MNADEFDFAVFVEARRATDRDTVVLVLGDPARRFVYQTAVAIGSRVAPEDGSVHRVEHHSVHARRMSPPSTGTLKEVVETAEDGDSVVIPLGSVPPDRSPAVMKDIDRLRSLRFRELTFVLIAPEFPPAVELNADVEVVPQVVADLTVIERRGFELFDHARLDAGELVVDSGRSVSEE